MSMLEPVYQVPSPVHFEEVVTSTSSSPSPLTTFLDKDSSSDGIDGVNYIQHLHKHQQHEIQHCQQTQSEVCGSFCVKWLNFGEHLRQSLQDLQDRKVHDSGDNVTFACQQNVHASTRRWVLHKAKRNVVMTTSLLLRNELQARPDDRPICLWDISSKTMTQVLHYIKHGIVLGPIREMNALIKANHILRVGAIWPNEYAYRLAALIGTSHNTNNKFRMSEHKPWIKTEIMESPVEQFEEIHDEMLIYEVPNTAMDSKTANELPPPLPPRRKSVIVDASEIWLPPKYQTKWFSPERLSITSKERIITPQALPKPQRQWDVTSGPNIILPPASDKEPIATSTAVQPTKSRNIYTNIFTSPDYTTQTQYQQNSSKNFYCQVLSAFDRQSSQQNTKSELNQNSTPPAPHNSPVDDNLPSSYEVITPPPQSTSCASVPAGVKMMSIYSTKQLQRSTNLRVLSPQTYPTLKPEMSVATTKSSANTALMPKPKSVESQAAATQKLHAANQTQSSGTSPETNQPPTIIPLPPFNQIKSSTSRMIPESQHFNQNPTPVLSHLIQNSSSTAALFGEHATSISRSQTRQAPTLPPPQIIPLVKPVLPQTLKPLTPPPPPPYNTQNNLPVSPQPPQATSASIAPMPRKKYIMALAYTQQTAQNNANSNLCTQEIRTPSTIPSSLQSTIIPPSSVQRPMPAPSPFPPERFSFTKPQPGLPPFPQKHKTSYPDVPNQIMGPPPPKITAKIPSTLTSAEYHYNTKQTLHPQNLFDNLRHHSVPISLPQQSISQQTQVVRMESFQKSQVVQSVQATHIYPTIVTKLSQQVTANHFQRQQPQIDLHRQYCKTPHSTAQFQQQQQHQQFQQQQRQLMQKQQQQQRHQFQQLQQRQQIQRQEQNQSWQPTSSSTQRSFVQTRAHPYNRQTTYTASSVYGYHQTSTPPFWCKWCSGEKTFSTKLQLRFHFLFEHKSGESLRNSPTKSFKAGNRATNNCTYNYKYLNQCRMSRGSN